MKNQLIKKAVTALICGGLVCSTVTFGQNSDNTVEVFFDEPIKDTGTTYYIVPEEDLISEKSYSGAEMITIDKKTFHFGMSELEVRETMDKHDDDVVIVLYAGGGQQENQAERNIDATIFRYENDLLYELAIQQPIPTSEGNYYGWTYAKIKENLGNSTYVNTFDAMKGSGLLSYKEKVGYKFFFFESGLVKEWGISNKDYRLTENWPLAYQVEQVIFPMGNTNGNIQNGGLITTEAGWYYYAQPTEQGERLYKMSSDGIFRQALANDSPRNINVKDGWLYYTNSLDWSNTGEGKIYRMKTDGTGREAISQVGASYLITDGQKLYFSTQGNGLNIIPGIYKMDLDGKHLTLLDPGQTKFLNIIDEDLFYVIDKTVTGLDESGEGDMAVTVDGVSAASQLEDEPVGIIRRMHVSGDYHRDFLEGRFAFLLANGYALYFSDKDASYKVYVLHTDNEIEGETDLISSVPVVAMNQQNGFTYFQTIFNEYVVTNSLYGADSIKWKEQQINQINVIGDKVFYQSQVDDVLGFYQKHQWKDEWQLMTPTLVEGAYLDHAVSQAKGDDTTKAEEEEGQLTYYIPADKMHYESNKWRYFDGVNMTIGRVSSTGYPEPEMVLQNAEILSAWDNDIYFAAQGFGYNGLNHMESNTKLITEINGLRIREGFIYKNLLIYTDKKTKHLYKSDLAGETVTLLDETDAKNIYVEDNWIYFTDADGTPYRIDLEGLNKENLLDPADSK